MFSLTGAKPLCEADLGRTALETSVRVTRNRQETRERILQSTQALLDRTSAQQFQIRDVAKEAGVSASLIIQYFNSKNDLVFESALRRLEILHAALTEQLAQTPPTGLEGVVSAFFACDFPVRHILRDLMALSWWWTARDDQRVAEAFRPREDALRSALEAAGKSFDAEDVQVLLDTYFSGLRHVLVNNDAPEIGLARIVRRVSTVAR